MASQATLKDALHTLAEQLPKWLNPAIANTSEKAGSGRTIGRKIAQ